MGIGIRLLEFLLVFLGIFLILRAAYSAWRSADVDYKIDELEEQEDLLEEVKSFKKTHPNSKTAKEEIEKFLNNK